MTEFWRLAYALLSILVSLGFGLTLALRWQDLARGERIIRAGIILEHATFVYGAYYAISHHLAPNVVLPVVVMSMLIMLLGLLDWAVNDLLVAYRRGQLPAPPLTS